MNDLENLFYTDLAREDELGLIIKAHLHIEHQLIEFIELHMRFKSLCDWQKISYASKIELSLGFGLPEDYRKILELLGKLRNNFAHNLSYNFENVDVLAIYNGLPSVLQRGIKHSYLSLNNQEKSPSKIPKKDLLVALLINVHQAIKAATDFKKKYDCDILTKSN